MIVVTTVTGRFSGGHRLPHPPCDKDHGHTWDVSISVQGDPDPDFDGHVCDLSILRSDLQSAMNELDGRDLDVMLRPAIASPNGVAAWFWERLSLKYKLDEVRVWHEKGEGSLRR